VRKTARPSDGNVGFIGRTARYLRVSGECLAQGGGLLSGISSPGRALGKVCCQDLGRVASFEERCVKSRRSISAAFVAAIATLGLVAAQPARSGASSSGELVFVSNASGRYQVYTRGVDGGSTANISNGPGTDSGPHWSPDGAKLVWSTDRFGHTQVVTANADGSNVTNISNNASPDGAGPWSPDGRTILFVRSNAPDNQIGVMSVSGANQTMLTTTGDGTNNGAPAWSPDGSKIVYCHLTSGNDNYDIATMNADGTGKTLLTSDLSEDCGPVYSPDGSKIYFGSTRNGSAHLFVMNSDGSNQTDLSPSGSDDFGPTVSPDGSQLAFTCVQPSGDWDLCIANADGSGRTDITNDGSLEGWAAWRPAAAPPPPPAITVSVGPKTALWKLDLTTDVTSLVPATCATTLTLVVSVPDDETPPRPHKVSKKLCGAGGQPLSKVTVPWPVFIDKTTAGQSYLLQPDHDYLATASISGISQSLSSTIHTPKPPVWVALGDSYSSGHHQDIDAPYCITSPSDCLTIPNDPAYSWIPSAVAEVNQRSGVPGLWAMSPDLLAMSGATTSDVVRVQLPTALSVLSNQRNSWDVVSLTGGADDLDFAGELLDWYSPRYIAGLVNDSWPATPWNVGPQSIATVSTECPNTNVIYGRSATDASEIEANIQTIFRDTSQIDAGVRQLDVLYPYVLETTNACALNYSSRLLGHWYGATSTVNAIDALHTKARVAGVIDIDPRTASGFGTSPLGDLQLTRYWGYPHPNQSGQLRLASLAAKHVN
jgi:hypothetical protein